MIIDLHTHTRYCRHATGTPAELVEAAIKKRVSHLGISDHYPLPKGFEDPAGDSAMHEYCLQQYWREVQELSKNKKIKVLKGVEVDYIPEYIDQIKNSLTFLESPDYLIGAVHFIEGWNFDFGEDKFLEGIQKYGTVDEIYKKYYKLIRKMCQTKMFEVVAHLDLPKKFNYYPANHHPKINPDIDETLDCIKDNNLVLEINTAGWRKPVKEQYPSEEIIKKAYKREIQITIGSDAHCPEDVGTNTLNAIAKAYVNGYRQITVFEKKERLNEDVFKLLSS